MIALELKIPIPAIQCLALLRRMPEKNPLRPIVERDLRSWMKGYYGEKECGYFLSFLPEDDYYIFHGLRLTDKKDFQMDIVILSLRFALIAEVKNVAKKIIFKKESNHVTKEFNNEEEGISNPILQVKRQQIQFLNWLRKKQMKGLPVERVVVISKTSTIIETTPDNVQIFKEIIYAESLIDRVKELEMKYPEPRISKKKLTQLVELLLEHHHTPIPDILPVYNLTPKEIKPGVICPKCQHFEMKYVSAKWNCHNCGHASKTAHIPAISDYFLLIGPTITRKQFCTFLHLDSSVIAGNMLRGLNLPATGTKRGTCYSLPKNCILFPLEENDIKIHHGFQQAVKVHNQGGVAV